MVLPYRFAAAGVSSADSAAAWADAGLDAELRRSGLAGQEAALAARLVYGVLQMAVALSIPILLRYNGQRGASPRWNTAMKWLFYLYYPAHLFLIGWLQWRA